MRQAITILMLLICSGALARETYIPVPAYIDGGEPALRVWAKKQADVRTSILDRKEIEKQRAWLLALGHDHRSGVLALDVYVYACTPKSCSLLMSRQGVRVTPEDEKPISLHTQAHPSRGTTIELRTNDGHVVLSSTLVKDN